MRGGGTRGAYEAGALKAMAELLEPIDIAYDVFAGVSIGALNGALLSSFDRGDEAEAIKTLVKLWQSYGITDLWDTWPIFGYFAMIWKQSVLDNQKLLEMVKKEMNGRSFKKMLNLISVDLNTGDVVIFDESTPIEKQPLAMMASASIPMIFPPQKELIKNTALTDGGLFTQVQLDEPIIRCKEQGYADEDIIVDLIACFAKVAEIDEWTLTQAKYKNAYDIYSRKELFEFYYYWYLEDILRIVKGFPKVNFRHLIMPTENLGGSTIPVFDGIEENLRLLEFGERDATEMIKAYLSNNKHHHYFDETDREFHHDHHDHDVKSLKPKLFGFDQIEHILKQRDSDPRY